jgi:ribosomal-protein-alanine N-acetyltransferase
MQPPERLTTARCHLRPPHLDDARAIFENYAADSAATRYLNWLPHQSVAETSEFLRQCIADLDAGHNHAWVITLPPADEAVGMIDARRCGSTVDLGYVLAPKVWGQGLAAEAVSAISEWCLGDGSIWRVTAHVIVGNDASCRVLDKAGFVCEGTLHRYGCNPRPGDPPKDVYSYARWRTHEESNSSASR